MFENFRKRIDVSFVNNEGWQVKLTSGLNIKSVIISDGMIAIQRKNFKLIGKRYVYFLTKHFAPMVLYLDWE